jgi:hypothetical protein
MAKKIDLKREVETGVNIFKQTYSKSLFAGAVEWEDLEPFLQKAKDKTTREAWRHQYRFCPLSEACSAYPSPKQMKVIEGLMGLGWDLSERLKMAGAPAIPALAALENRNVRMLKGLMKLGFDVFSQVPAIRNKFNSVDVKEGCFWFVAASSLGYIEALKNEKPPSPEEVEAFFFPGLSVDEKLERLLQPDGRVWMGKMAQNDLLIKIFKRETLKGLFNELIKEAVDDFKGSKTNRNYGALVMLSALVKSDALGKEEKAHARKLLWAEEILQGRGCTYNRMTEVGMLWGKEEKGREFLFEVTIRNPALLKSKKLLMTDRKYLWNKLEEKTLMNKASVISSLYSSFKNIVKREWLENNWKECPMIETVQKTASHILEIEMDPIKLGSIEEELLWLKNVGGFDQKQWNHLIERVEERANTASPNGFIQKFYAVLQKDKLLDLADAPQTQKKHRAL